MFQKLAKPLPGINQKVGMSKLVLSHAIKANASIFGVVGALYAVQKAFENYQAIRDAEFHAHDEMGSVYYVDVDQVNKIKENIRNQKIGLLNIGGFLDRDFLKRFSLQDEVERKKLEELRDKEDLTEEEKEELKELEIKDAKNIAEQIIRSRLNFSISENTVIPGVAGVILFTSILVAALAVFAPISFPVLAMAAGASVLIGGAVVAAATYQNRKYLGKQLDKAIAKDSFQGKIKKKALDLVESKKKGVRSIKHAAKKTKLSDLYREARNNRSVARFIRSDLLYIAGVYSLLLSPIAISATLLVSNLYSIAASCFSGVANYFTRQKKLEKFDETITDALVNNIHQSKGLFNRRSIFSEYVKAHGETAELRKMSIRDLQKLKYDNPELYSRLEKAAIADDLGKRFQAFCDEKCGGEVTKENFDLFTKEQIEKVVAADVRGAGYGNTAGIATGIMLTGAIAFPPLLLGFAIVAGATMLVGSFVTEVVNKSEQKKFTEKFDDVKKQFEEERGDIESGRVTDTDPLASLYYGLYSCMAKGAGPYAAAVERTLKQERGGEAVRSDVHAARSAARAHGHRLEGAGVEEKRDSPAPIEGNRESAISRAGASLSGAGVAEDGGADHSVPRVGGASKKAGHAKK